MFDKDNKFGFIINNNNKNNNSDIKKYVDDNTVIHPLPIYKISESPSMITYTVNIMDLKKLTTYGAIRDMNSTKYQRYRFVYICDDGKNKTIVNTGDDINDTTFRVYHYGTSSTLTFNNVRYSVDYTKHNTPTDVIVTESIQNYLGIYNTREYTPTEDYNPATKKYVDDGITYNNKQFNNKISAIHMSKHPVSCSTEIYKKPLCDIFPELLNITYNTVFKESNSFKVNMDNFAKEYPTVKSAYNKLNINLYDENDNSIGNSYGGYINGDGLNIIFINITESLRFYAYFDKALVDGSGTTMETKNGYMTIQLLIPKGNNKQEFIDKIKNLKLTLSVFRADFLNLNNETIYTPTTDYNPATKKYVDDKVSSLPQFSFNENGELVVKIGDTTKIFVPKE